MEYEDFTTLRSRSPRNGNIPNNEETAANSQRIKEYPVDKKRLLALFAPHKLALIAVTLIIVATSILSIAQPFIVRDIIDKAIPQQNVPLLLALVGGLVAITVISQGLGVIQSWKAAQVGQRVMHTVREKVYINLSHQSINFFTRTRTGDVQSRLINDVSGMQGVLTTTASAIAINLTTAIATVIAMLALSPALSALSLVILPPAVILTRKVAQTRRELTNQRQRALASMQAHISETISVSGIRLSQTLGTHDRNVREFSDISESLINLALKSELAGRWRMATMRIIFAIIPAAVYLIAGLAISSETISIGTLLAFTTLQTQVFRPIMGLLDVGAQWISSMALFSRIFEYLDLVPEVPEPTHPIALPHATNDSGDGDAPAGGAVTFNHVSYSYPEAEAPVFEDFNLEIAPGATVAVVGHTGSGKSTLAGLLARLMDPSKGEVLVDGVDLRDVNSAERTARIGVISQESYLLHDTIRVNLMLAKPNASENELWQALEAAQAASFVRGLPEGLDTMVGERGYRFSGGEQQRLAIARTILKNPQILILDEATSALDNETERAVQAAFDKLSAHRTTLVIAHRLSTVTNADKIVVLDQGQIVEQGTYAELIESRGAFYALVQADKNQLTKAA